MFEVMIEDCFSAAHRLLDYDGDEDQVHGHTWKVKVFVRGTNINTSGILIDFKVLKASLKEILNNLDHKDLNTIDEFKDLSPSSELIAKYIYIKLKSKYSKINRVSVCESEYHMASYWDENNP
ncbi:MAG: 6-carboxytetrahydropterin synthase [Cyanobacteriota bacterium]